MTTFQINEHITIECKPFSRGFGHSAYLYVNGYYKGRSSIRYYNRTWESFTYESVLYRLAENNRSLYKTEREEIKQYIKNYANGETKRVDKMFTGIAAIAKMGEALTTSKKESNDWKTRMLKAGLENKGLIMPENWDSLSETVKEERLNKVINAIA